MNVSRRGLQRVLGVVWLLDAALQYQPYMFGRGFASQSLTLNVQGNPGWIATPIMWTVHIVEHQPVACNAGFATIQLLLALGLFSRRTVKLSLACSIPWALMVWWLGEGLGGLFGAAPSPLMGAPGAVILYALLAVLLWPRGDDAERSVAEGSLLHPLTAKVLWCALWGSFVYEVLLPVNRAPNASAQMVAGMAGGEPGWIASLNTSAGSELMHHGLVFSIVLAWVMALVGLSVFAPPALTRAGLAAGALVALTIWVVGEDFGGIFTGSGTDPNSGPLLVLLAAAYWPRNPVPVRGQSRIEGRQPVAVPVG